MVRILQVSHAYPPTFGGVESHVWDISHGLAARGHTVQVLTGGQSHVDDGAGPVRVRRDPAIGVQPLLAARRGSAPEELRPELHDLLGGVVATAVDDFGPEVVHLHNGHHFGPASAAAEPPIPRLPRT